MLLHIVQAVVAGLLVLLAPGYAWARLLMPSRHWVDVMVVTVACSVGLVPAVALLLVVLFGTGLNVWVAAASVLIVLIFGQLLYRVLGAPYPVHPPQTRHAPQLSNVVLLPVLLALALMVAETFSPRLSQRLAAPTSLLMLAGGIVYMLRRRRAGAESGRTAQAGSGPRLGAAGRVASLVPPNVHRLLVPLVMWLTLARAYMGPVKYDWPFIRGLDQYIHTILVELTIREGTGASFAVYPPGFHMLSAVMVQLSGLQPLDLYPILAPSLVLLPAMGSYSLAGWVFGRSYALPSMVLSGLLLTSPMRFLNDGTYVDLLAAEFLVLVALLALVVMLVDRTWRGIILFALTGALIPLYHTITTLYFVLLILGVMAVAVPYIWRRDRRLALGVLGGLAGMGLLSAGFVWRTYDIPGTVSALLGLAPPTMTAEHVGNAVGTQKPLSLGVFPSYLSIPVVQLGLLGFVLLAVEVRRFRFPHGAAVLVLLWWTMILLVGSRTAYSGFPWRFTRDLGAPLVLLAAFALVTLLSSGIRGGRVGWATLGLLAVLLATQIQGSLVTAARPSRIQLMLPTYKEAGEWLRANNTGGRIVSTPYFGYPMLALSGYTELSPVSISDIRSRRFVLPSLQQRSRDVRWLYTHPGGQRTRDILRQYDVRYLVLPKRLPSRFPVRSLDRVRYTRFMQRPDLYSVAFENRDVIIFRVSAS